MIGHPVPSEGTAPRGGDHVSTDQSGLIDIHALMAAAQSAAPRAPEESGVVQHIAVYPLGAPPSQRTPEPLPVAPVVAPEPPRPSHAKKAVAAAIALALAGAAAALLLGRTAHDPGADGRADNGGQALSTPVESPRVGTAADPQGKPAPADRGNTAVDTAAADSRAPATTPQRPGTQRPQKGQGVQKIAAVQKPPAVTPPVADPCKGDLLCNMKRSTEHH